MSNPRIYPGPTTDTIRQGAEFIRQHLLPGPPERAGGQAGTGDGSICPCCEQRVVLDKRSLNFQTALVLLELYFYHLDPGNSYWDFYTNSETFSRGYMHMPTMLEDHPEAQIKACVKNREHGRMVMWGLIITKKMDVDNDRNRDPENKRTAGYYRINNRRGVDFVTNARRIPRWFWIWQNHPLFKSDRHADEIIPERINIEGMLGSHFHFSEITPPGYSVETLEQVTERGRDRYHRYYPSRANS